MTEQENLPQIKLKNGHINPTPMEVAKFFSTYPIPGFVLHIAQELAEHGFASWLVGGCVRDALIGQPVHDWDMCTTALPSDVVSIFPSSLKIGIAYGTVEVKGREMNVEVTTLRGDGISSNGRHPDEVTFTTSIVEDLSRRDFTVNAMAISLNGSFELVDPFNGINDIFGWTKLIRCVGAPADRFAEDGLRTLRAVRFISSAGFREIEHNTLHALKACDKERLSFLSRERVTSEFLKMLKGCDQHGNAQRVVDAFNLLRKTGLLSVVCPALAGLSDHTHQNLLGKLGWLKTEGADTNVILASLYYISQDPEFWLTADIEASKMGTFDAWKGDLAELRLSRADTDKVRYLVDMANETPSLSDMADWRGVDYRKWASKVGRDNLDNVLLVKAVAQGPNGRPSNSSKLEQIREDLKFAIEGNALTVGELKITGASIMEGLDIKKPCKAVGECLNRLLEAVLESPSLNTEKALINMVMRGEPILEDNNA